MFVRRLLSVVLGLVLVVMTVEVAGGDGHLITDKYNNVDPDGYWTAEVPAGEHQLWNFDLEEPRDHNILVEIVEPPGASLGVSMDDDNLGSASMDSILSHTGGVSTEPGAVHPRCHTLVFCTLICSSCFRALHSPKTQKQTGCNPRQPTHGYSRRAP